MGANGNAKTTTLSVTTKTNKYLKVLRCRVLISSTINNSNMQISSGFGAREVLEKCGNVSDRRPHFKLLSVY